MNATHPEHAAAAAEPVLSVRDLQVAFKVDKQLKEVVHGVSFDVVPR